MKKILLSLAISATAINYATAQLITNDFKLNKAIGSDIETGIYTTKTNATPMITDGWHLINYDGLNTDGASPKIIAPLTYPGYIESGASNAFEMLKLTETNGSRQTGYSLTNTTAYSTDAYYLAYGKCF